jgi:hypothetical protein
MGSLTPPLRCGGSRWQVPFVGGWVVSKCLLWTFLFFSSTFDFRLLTFDLLLSKWFYMNGNKSFFAINVSQFFFNTDGDIMCLNNVHIVFDLNMQVDGNILSDSSCLKVVGVMHSFNICGNFRVSLILQYLVAMFL